MPTVIRFTTGQLPILEELMRAGVESYRPGLTFETIPDKEFSQILHDLTRGSQVTHPDGLFTQITPKAGRSLRNITEIIRVMRTAFGAEYTDEQVINAATYFSQNSGPAYILGHLIVGAVLLAEFQLMIDTSILPLKVDQATQKIIDMGSKKPRRAPNKLSGPEPWLTQEHIIIQPDEEEFHGNKILGFSQFYATKSNGFTALSLDSARYQGSDDNPALTMIIKTFMPLAPGAVPIFKEFVMTIADFNDSQLSKIIRSMKDALPACPRQPLSPQLNPVWVFPPTQEGFFAQASSVVEPPPGVVLRWQNSYNYYLTILTGEQIEEAYRALADDIKKLGLGKLENITSTRKSLQDSPSQSRRNTYLAMPQAPAATETTAQENWLLQQELMAILKSKGFVGYTEIQLSNLCVAIGETRFNYLKAIVREVQELLALIGCRLESYDDSKPLYTIAPRSDRASFKYSYQANWTTIIINSRVITPQTYGLPPNTPLLNIFIEIVFPLVTGIPIEVKTFQLTSYVLELNTYTQNIKSQLQSEVIQKRCLAKWHDYQRAERAARRVSVREQKQTQRGKRKPSTSSVEVESSHPVSQSPAVGELLASPLSPPWAAASAASSPIVGHVRSEPSALADGSPSRRLCLNRPASANSPTTRLTRALVPSSSPASAMGRLRLSSHSAAPRRGVKARLVYVGGPGDYANDETEIN